MGYVPARRRRILAALNNANAAADDAAVILQRPYRDRYCSDCVYLDPQLTGYCHKFDRQTNPTFRHTPDRQCPHYLDLFDAASRGIYFDWVQDPDIVPDDTSLTE